jgi:ATP-dependent Clp protease ATP-binding subunit ClpB
MRKQWESEKQQADQIQTLKDRMQQLRQEAEQAERDGNYAKVAEIRYSKLPEIEKESLSLSTSTEGKENRMLRDEVTADDIADVVSRWTGIPVTKMQTSETEKLLHLEEELHKRVVGQEEAIAAVCNAVRRSRAGLQDPKRPIGSFIFLGSTGVGKTELAKALAEYLFDDETMMTRIDMSEYQEKFSVTRLIGAPPGYVGYDEGGQLTEAVRRKPYQVVLFDEIEKAHPDVFNTLLQVLDDGRLTDSKGRTVNFKNTIIIMTSNLLTGADLDKGEDNVRNLLVQRGIRPEFLNRIDETIVFHPLNWGEVKQIVRLQVESIQKMLRENGLTLEISDAAIDLLANEGYDPDFGARPVKRAVQRLLLDGLSKELLAGRLDRNRPIRVDATEDRITME